MVLATKATVNKTQSSWCALKGKVSLDATSLAFAQAPKSNKPASRLNFSMKAHQLDWIMFAVAFVANTIFLGALYASSLEWVYDLGWVERLSCSWFSSEKATRISLGEKFPVLTMKSTWCKVSNWQYTRTLPTETVQSTNTNVKYKSVQLTVQTMIARWHTMCVTRVCMCVCVWGKGEGVVDLMRVSEKYSNGSKLKHIVSHGGWREHYFLFMVKCTTVQDAMIVGRSCVQLVAIWH